MRSQSKENAIKFAIRIHPELYDENKEKVNWFLYHYDKGEKNLINSIIEYGKEYWNLDPNKEYSLIITIDEAQNLFRFITDEQQYRSCFTQGAVIELYYSVRHVVSEIMHQIEHSIREQNQDRQSLLNKIHIYASDQAFALEFERQNGIKLILSAFVSNKFNDFEVGLILKIMAKILEHDCICWTNTSLCMADFIEKIIDLILNNKYSTQNISDANDEDRHKLLTSIVILESMIINRPETLLPIINQKLPLSKLTCLIKYEHFPDVQLNVLALLNAMFQYQTHQVRIETFKFIQEALIQHVIDRCNKGSELIHQLYVLQTLLLRVYEDKLTKGASAEQTASKWAEIQRNFDFEIDNPTRNHIGKQSSSSESLATNNRISQNHYDGVVLLKNFDEPVNLGLSENDSTLAELFSDPPGLFILDLLIYFSKEHNESFVRFILANHSSFGDLRSNGCPLIVASFRIFSLLVNFLELGKPPRDESRDFYPMFLKHDKPLEEFFCVALSIFNRTWCEIHATINDIDIACDFLAEKLQKKLTDPNATISFDQFHKELSKITYNEISHLWREERFKRERKKEEMSAIKELRRLLQPTMMNTIKQNRLNYLIRGTRFDKYTIKGQRIKDKFWYCRLSNNYKTLLYGDVEEDCKNLDSKLTMTFDIADADRLLLGKECPHMRDIKNKKTTLSLAFALIARQNDGQTSQNPLCFVASKSEIYDFWVDGLNALLGLEMSSNETQKDLTMLLDLDVKLRLLDIEGIDVPDQAPEIPPSPPNYNFEFEPHKNFIV